MSAARRACTIIGLAALAACAGADSVAPRASVVFMLDAPFCGGPFPVQFLIDSVPVGIDTFRVNVAVGVRTTSHAFAIPPGRHVLGAHVVAGYVWPDTTVTVVAGQAITRSLPFYCS